MAFLKNSGDNYVKVLPNRIISLDVDNTTAKNETFRSDKMKTTTKNKNESCLDMLDCINNVNTCDLDLCRLDKSIEQALLHKYPVRNFDKISASSEVLLGKIDFLKNSVKFLRQLNVFYLTFTYLKEDHISEQNKSRNKTSLKYKNNSFSTLRKSFYRSIRGQKSPINLTQKLLQSFERILENLQELIHYQTSFVDWLLTIVETEGKDDDSAFDLKCLKSLDLGRELFKFTLKHKELCRRFTLGCIDLCDQGLFDRLDFLLKFSFKKQIKRNYGNQYRNSGLVRSMRNRSYRKSVKLRPKKSKADGPTPPRPLSDTFNNKDVDVFTQANSCPITSKIYNFLSIINVLDRSKDELSAKLACTFKPSIIIVQRLSTLPITLNKLVRILRKERLLVDNFDQKVKANQQAENLIKATNCFKSLAKHIDDQVGLSELAPMTRQKKRIRKPAIASESSKFKMSKFTRSLTSFSIFDFLFYRKYRP